MAILAHLIGECIDVQFANQNNVLIVRAYNERPFDLIGIGAIIILHGVRNSMSLFFCKGKWLESMLGGSDDNEKAYN
ncbi:hypothetical protein QD46_24475 [Paenibacillus polymyxa]|nr:hypothetical protein QD46_24475 [Paenibacillus polymyxa]